MAYRIPTFNLTSNVWHGAFGNPFDPAALPPLPDLTPMCQLCWNENQAVLDSLLWTHQDVAGALQALHPMLIRFPRITDIRGYTKASSGGAGTRGLPDVIEVPAGSGRYYVASMVDDVAKGFVNEYRQAWCFQVWMAVPTP
jgi:hypothetical protein